MRADTVIFGGTTEGRILADFCAAHGIPVWISVATEYGKAMLAHLETSPCVRILTGRRDSLEMAGFFAAEGIRRVYDATHPYAVEVSGNIRRACGECGIPCRRVLRNREASPGDGRYFGSIPEVVDFLNTDGNGAVLITTGSKELREYCRVRDFRMRCAVRVLPTEGIPEACDAMGFDPSRVIAARGPFSEEENLRHLRLFRASWLVTKDSGSAGGFAAKIRAAQRFGASALIIRRPDENGISVQAAEQMLLTEAGI